MTTTTTGPWTWGSTVHGHDVIGDRYHLRSRRAVGDGQELWWADDTRLGRAVLLRRHLAAAFPTRVVHRLLRTECTGVARVLDAGADHADPGALAAYTVFPASDRPSLADVPAEQWTTTAAAGVAAWLIAVSEQVQTVCGATVAVSTDDVLVDPRVFDGSLPADCCAVHWMPAFDAAGDGSDLHAVVAALLAAAVRNDRRGRRRVDAALALLSGPYGRRRAAVLLADLAGLDPRLLGLPAAGPRHADPTRRSSDRRVLAGIVPVTTRKDLTCESAEAFS